MATRIRKLTNISNNPISVILESGNSIYLPSKGVLENITLKDLSGIANWVKVELDLSEVNPITEGRIRLNS